MLSAYGLVSVGVCNVSIVAESARALCDARGRLDRAQGFEILFVPRQESDWLRSRLGFGMKTGGLHQAFDGHWSVCLFRDRFGLV